MGEPRSIAAARAGGLAAEPDGEQRTPLRYPIALTAKFFWNDPDGVRQQGQGTTRDVSPFGAFIASSAHPAVGSTVQLEIVLRVGAPRGTLKMRARGRVLRTSGDGFAGKCGGFAVVSDGFHLFREDAVDRDLGDSLSTAEGLARGESCDD